MKNSTRLLLVLASGLLLASTGLSISSAVQCASTNTDLQKQNTELIQQIEDKDTALDGYKDLIEDYEGLIKDYEDEIASMENNVYYTATYDVAGTISTELIKKGEVAVAVPTSTNSIYIKSWHLEDGTEIDVLTHKFTEDVSLFAETETRYLFSWSAQCQNPTDTSVKLFSLASSYLSQSEFVFPTLESLSSKIADEYPGWKFDHWFITNSGYENLKFYPGDTFEFSDSISRYNIRAYLTKDITATFKVDTEIVASQDFVLNSGDNKGFVVFVDTTSLETPTKEGYTFTGWALEGAEDTIIDLSTYKLKENTTFVAVFEANE